MEAIAFSRQNALQLQRSRSQGSVGLKKDESGTGMDLTAVLISPSSKDVRADSS
jgi:hypothetical protein